MKISNKAYDILNVISKVVAPAATFVSAILVIWKVPYTEQITARLGALDVFIGGLVIALKASYNKANK